MNFVTKITSLPNLLMNKFSSVFLASDNMLGSLLDSDNIFTRILRVILQFFYFSMKWLMYMIDIIYFYVLQLVGVTADTTIFDSSRSDPTFRMLIDNKKEVTTYIKNFIAIALLLIIITAIIALIKLQAQAMRDAKIKKTPTGDVLKSMMKSVILIIITPMIAILGIIASSVMLQGLYRATNLSNSKSLGGRIFNASASAANKYKAYADKGVRIPIRYCFTGDDKADAIVYASTMVGNNSFPSIEYFNENNTFSGDFFDPVMTDEIIEAGEYKSGADAWLNEKYYKYFDRSDEYNEEYTLEQHMIMKTHRNEYYAMSDVIGYALDTMEPYYFVTIQELLESLKDNSTVLTSVVEGQKIRTVSSGRVSTSASQTVSAIKNGSYDAIQYISKYKDGEHTYYHVKDAVDEIEGAKFTIAYKHTEDSTTYENSIYGDYVYTGGTHKKIEKFFYRESPTERFKKVDLYYELNRDTGRYVKATAYSASEELYYRIGDDYVLLTTDNRDNFYYRLEDGTYQSFTLGANFKEATKKEYYLPLVVGVSVNNSARFTSEYILPSNIITARGVFDETSYPTAIRRLNNGNIMFYRDDLELVTEGSVSDVGKLEEIEAEEDEGEEEEEEQGFFSKVGGAIKSAWNSVKTFVASIFNPLKLVPDLAIDESRMASTYTNKTKSVAQLEDGKMHISYFFGDSITSKLTKNMYAFNLNHLFEPMSINYIVLVLGSVVLFKVILTAVFGVINRSLSLFIMILIYPLACATLPLDEASGTAKSGSYARWSERYTKLLFSTFGLLLSINFVFIIIPVIDKLEFFTPENLQNNAALARIADALYNPLKILQLDKLLSAMGFKIKTVEPNYYLISAFINKILRIVFQIAAFSLLSSTNGKGGGGSETFYSVIQGIVKPGGEGVLEDSPMDAVKKTLKTMATTFNLILFPHKAVLNVLEKSAEEIKKVGKDMIPGSAIIEDASKKAEALGLKINQDEARKALLNVLKSGGASPDVVQDKLKAFQDTHNVK